jgi:uncharacterized protein (TIGR02270 family)
VDVAIEIYGQHCAEASALWMLRDLAARDAAYRLADLAELDERLDAHLDGLRLGGDAAWEVCKAALEDAEEGEAFVAATLAIHRRDLHGVAYVLDMAAGPVDAARGIVAALGWVTPAETRAILPGLLHGSCPAILHYLGVAGAAVQRIDPGERLGYALFSDHLRLRARALRAVAECRRIDLRQAVASQLRDGDEACRFAAAWSATLLREPSGPAALWEVARQGGSHALRAVDLAARALDPAEAARGITELRYRTGGPRLAVAAARALGDPAQVPWLLEAMEDPELTRFAGDAFATLSGVDLVAARLHRDASPESRNEDVLDPEHSLPWPDPARVAQWWRLHGGRLEKGTRHVLGKPVERGWLERVLREGTQALRASAAQELCLLEPGRALPEVRGPAFRQLAEGFA